MFKLMITVSLFLQLVLRVECFNGPSPPVFSGDNCKVDNESGRCVAIKECPHIYEEVRRAGNPMPPLMRRKLQKITCGFESKEPMICCASSGSIQNHNTVGTDDDVEAYTRATLENKNGPVNVDSHPNLGLLPTKCGNIESDRIWGGNRTRLYEMPWMVLLSYDSPRGVKLSCGGSLISEWYVLTAAHCVVFLDRMKLEAVILGEHDVSHDPDCEMSDGIKYCAPPAKHVPVASIVAHPGYTRQSQIDDIALIRLSEPADFTQNSMKPLCLPMTPELQAESLVGHNAVVAGWGVAEDGIQSSVLLSVDLPVLSHSDCMAAYRGALKLKNTQICAGGVKDKDSCAGDSGGPLMYPGQFGKLGVRYIQRGLVSYGPKRCGIGGFPGVYTNVAYYMDWILDNMQS
ncbi:hypothetical protein B5X24_HaOG206841 [Helicoverpa armigera]|uniref:CLIP domain-containing serine protease n=1 Tax=Helicoverpa armigera TaxID=29058 RepID=A0A2W1BQ49_HELAM|nr:hypothetical protein B5X24_HaOG206841 [Helicoverpa armigera]